MTGHAAPPRSRVVLDFVGRWAIPIELDRVRLLTDAVGDVVGWQA